LNQSVIRLLHASPDTPAVDIYVNGDLVTQDLSYEEITDYHTVVPGEHNVKVFLTGETTNPVVDVDLQVTGEEPTTIAVVGTMPQVSLLPVIQAMKCPDSQQALVRFVHLSPDAPLVDITLPDSTKLLTEVEYQEVSDYLPVKEGTYDFQVRPSGIDTVIFDIPGINFKSGQLYTVYALGRLEGQPDLKALVVSDTTAYCVREREVLPPPQPDVKPYNWHRMQIRFKYR